MAIAGIQVINIGLPNESTGSDSLYTAFNKTETNFNTLFACASPYNTFTGTTGISTTANATTGVVEINNTGVTSIIAGTGVVINQANGAVTISSTGGGGGSGGTVTSVGVSSTTMTVTGSPIISAGIIDVNLSNSGVVAGSYTYPTMSVDAYGRVTSIANAASVGTVTSIGLTTSGTGIQLSGGPITSAGNINIINTGVTRLSAGTGINLSGSNGNVTVSATLSGGTVTSVGISSSQLVVSGSPVTTTGTMSIDLPTNLVITGNITGGNLISYRSIKSNNTGGVGYANGAGGTIAQTISRTTGVTINKITGAITLVSAAGTATYQTFTVTNSTVAATDVIIVNQKSGTDKYEVFVTNVASTSFAITFATTGGTTTEQPVFNFAVIKAVAA